MFYLSTLLGATNYEFRMQVRRLALWLTFMLLGMIFIIYHQPWFRPITSPVNDALVYWAGEMQMLLAIAAAILLADRLPREHRTHVDELHTTFANPLSARLLGKFVGSTLATLLPMVVVYGVGVGYILNRWHVLSAWPVALASFAALIVPGVLFVGALSIACTALLSLPLYQLAFVLYWFWGNLLPPEIGIPTISDTMLTPIGSYTCSGLFNQGSRELVCGTGLHGITPLQGVESIALLIGSSLVLILLLTGYLRWKQGRQ